MRITPVIAAITFGGLLSMVVVGSGLADDDSESKEVSPTVSKPITVGAWQRRPFVKKWKVEDLAADANDLSGHSIRQGREVFKLAGCIQCHAVEGQGGKFGAKLSDLAKRSTGPELLRQILKPSSEITKAYETHIFLINDGRVISGFVVKDAAEDIHVIANPNHPKEIQVIQKSKIEERHKSKVSAMPEGALYTFNREEILDLLAFVQAGGKTKK